MFSDGEGRKYGQSAAALCSTINILIPQAMLWFLNSVGQTLLSDGVPTFVTLEYPWLRTEFGSHTVKSACKILRSHIRKLSRLALYWSMLGRQLLSI